MAEENKTVAQEVSEDPVISEIRNSLTNEAERVSSQTTGIEDTINEAVSNTRQAGANNEKRIDSTFDRQRNEGVRAGQNNIDNFAESRGGFATQMTALRNVVNETDTYLKDLDSRREEAQLANNSQMLNQINGLIVQGEQMKMDALQSTFDNMLKVSSLGLQARQFDLSRADNNRQFELTYELDGERFQLQKDQQSFQERNAIAGVALEFGLEVNPEDTIDTVVDRAAATGIVDQTRALELEQMRASIRASNAQAAKALRQDPSEKPFDPVTAEILANAYRNGQTEFLAGLKTNEQYASVINTVNKQNEEEIQSLQELAGQAEDEQDFLNTINSMTAGLPEAEKARITSSATTVAGSTEFPTKESGGQSLPAIISAGAQGWSAGTQNFLEFVTGVAPR